MDEINKVLEIFPDDPRLICLMGRIYAQKGEKDKTREILDELHKRSKKEYVSPALFATLYTDLEEMDKEMEYLEEVLKNHDYWIFLFQYRHLPFSVAGAYSGYRLQPKDISLHHPGR